MTDEVTGQQAAPQGESVSAPEATTAPETGTEQTDPNANATENALTEEHPEGEEELPPGLKKRFAKLTAQKYESRRAAEEAAEREAAAKREADALRATIEAMRKEAPESTPAKPTQEPVKPVDLESLVKTEAQKQLQAQKFNDDCNAVYEKGKASHADFDDAVSVLRNVGVMSQPFIEAAIETGSAPDILYHLGQNPDEADRLRSLSPVKLGVEMAKLATTLSKPKPVSAAPAPIKPVDGSARPVIDLEKAGMADYVRIRSEQRAQRRR